MANDCINSEKHFCDSGGMVYALVLGTNFLRKVRVQVSPVAPRVTLGKNCYPSSKLHGIGSCTRSCTLIKKLHCKMKGVAELLGNLLSVSLRNVCHILIISTTAYNLSISTSIFVFF